MQWLQKGYTIEQIKEETDKVNLELPEEHIKQAEKLYKEWKKQYPNITTKHYKGKSTDNGEEGR